MRQFILIPDETYNNSGLRFDGKSIKLDDFNPKKNKSINFILENKHGDCESVIPISSENFSYVKSEYSPATSFSATFNLPSTINVGTYSFIIVRKGAKFNERNKWTVSVYVKDTSMTTKDLVEKFVEQFVQYKDKLGMAVTPAGTTALRFTGPQGIDFEIKGADELMGIKYDEDSFTNGIPAINDAAYIKDLADKAAADRGYEYTYQEANELMYPNRSLNELQQLDPNNKGFTVYTLKFAEKRETKTTDTAINQIVQIAHSNSFTMSTFVEELKIFAGESITIGT